MKSNRIRKASFLVVPCSEALSSIRQYLKSFCEKQKDYILLESAWLAQYKAQKPNGSKLASAEFVVTKL